jgi:chromate transport protein ChrA
MQLLFSGYRSNMFVQNNDNHKWIGIIILMRCDIVMLTTKIMIFWHVELCSFVDLSIYVVLQSFITFNAEIVW